MALADMPSQQVGVEAATAVANGVPLTGGGLTVKETGFLRIVDESGGLLAVYHSDGAIARPEVVLS